MNMPAGEFKAKCLQVMDDVEKYHQEVVITKFGRPVAKLVPIEKAKSSSLFGYMKGSVKIYGDIMSTGVKWNANA